MGEKPEKPKDSDCCGSGCNPCIFDVYEKQLKLWESNILQENTKQVLDPVKYSPFRLTEIKPINSNVNLYTFQLFDNEQPIETPIRLKMGDYAILKGNDGEQNFSRPYTILLNDFLKYGKFQVIVKLYPDGKMSQFFGKMKEDEAYFWRGPYNHFPYKMTRIMYLLGAGTGVIPLYNIAKEIVNNENVDTLIKSICCFQNIESIILRKEFHELSSFWNFKNEFFVSTSNENPVLFYNEKVNFRKIDASILTGLLEEVKTKDILIVICGTKNFNDFCHGVAVCIGVSEENIVIL